MSWFKMFSAVLVANIVSWVIVTIIGWLVFFVFMDALGDEFERRMSSGPKIELSSDNNATATYAPGDPGGERKGASTGCRP